MNNRTLLGLSLLALSISTGQAAMAADEKGEGFIEGSSLTILNRNLYLGSCRDKGKIHSLPSIHMINITILKNHMGIAIRRF